MDAGERPSTRVDKLEPIAQRRAAWVVFCVLLAASPAAAAQPDIDVEGQGVSILDGDTTPSPADDTDFGLVLVAGGSVAHVFTIRNLGNADLEISAVATTGAHAGDFAVSGFNPPVTLTPASSTTFTVTFEPSAGGLRSATLEITSTDPNENPYDFAIQGTGDTQQPDIDVQGQGISIPDGDTTPSVADDTDFGPVNVDGGTAAHVFAIRNEGTVDLEVTSVVRSGPHAADFAVSGIALPATIAPAGSTPFTVTFDPSAVGLRSAAIDIASDDPDENPYDFSIQGTGAVPEIDVEGQGISIPDGDVTPSVADDTDFGTAAVGGAGVAHVFTIRNEGVVDLQITSVISSGTHAGDFGVSGISPPLTLGPAGSTTFTVTFDPSAAGLRKAAIDIGNSDPDESPYDFSIQGTGTIPQPEIDVEYQGVSIPDGDLTPSVAEGTDFGDADVDGATVVHVFEIQNEGTDDLEVTSVISSGAHATDFEVSGIAPPVTIAPASFTTFTLTFDPSVVGLRSAAIDIANDDPDEGAYDFSIQGTGTAALPEIDVEGQGISIPDGDLTPSVADDTDFGTTDVNGGTAAHVFTIQNEGTDDLEVTSVISSGAHAADFAVSGIAPPVTITPMGATNFTVTFDPSAPGLRSAAIDIANNDPDENPYDFSIQGTGGGPLPDIDVEGQGISIPDGDLTPSVADDTDFGTAGVGGAGVAHVFTIQNEGTDDLEVTSVVTSGVHAADFSVSGISLPVTLAPAASTTFTVTFEPSDDELRSAAIDIVNDDPDENPYDFSIQGTGSFQVPALPGALGVGLLAMALAATGAARVARGTARARR